MYVYAVKCHGYFKIGKANAPKRRLANLQCGCPYKLSIAITVRLPSEEKAHTAERLVHRALAAYWHRDEWFAAPEDVVITALKGAADILTAPRSGFAGRRLPPPLTPSEVSALRAQMAEPQEERTP